MADSFDVIVAGSGCAGAMAAIAAADAGARVLLVEKSPHLGGTTMLSSGFARVASEAKGAADYLEHTSAGRISRPLAEALALGMTEVPGVLRELAARGEAKVSVRFGAQQASNETEDLYDWPGRDSLGWAGIESVAGFDHYPWVHGGSKGQLLMRVLERNIEQRAIDVWLDTPARCLQKRKLSDGTNEITGLVVEHNGREIAIEAQGGVILATGGFEFNAQMLRDYLEIPVLLPMGHAGNTGDGIAMAMEAGAALWHMWHIHGSYGFKLPNHPVAVRNPLGGARNPARPLAWILADQNGERFTNELPRAPQDTLARPLSRLNEETGRHDRIPAWMIFDDNGRKRGPIGRPVAAQPEHVYDWSKDNSKEIAKGWIRQAPNLQALAAAIKVPADALVRTIATWNNAVASGRDSLFDRPEASMVAIDTPPFHAIDVWPVVSNTQGGPVHDEHQQVLDVHGQPIAGLFAAGELGSFFGHIYLLGGNISEGIAGGRIAARRAAERASTHAKLAQ
ncbi:MAG: FAD-dependent oxidoreductase [Betaproteobacteria bacterium]|nr:FAD-dependent oxidoreductase [Betaproteobacteria bacterium]